MRCAKNPAPVLLVAESSNIHFFVAIIHLVLSWTIETQECSKYSRRLNFHNTIKTLPKSEDSNAYAKVAVAPPENLNINSEQRYLKSVI